MILCFVYRKTEYKLKMICLCTFLCLCVYVYFICLIAITVKVSNIQTCDKTFCCSNMQLCVANSVDPDLITATLFVTTCLSE